MILVLVYLLSIQIISAFVIQQIPPCSIVNTRINMGWSDTWSNIIGGGNPRWKVTCTESHEKALSHFQQYVTGDPSQISVLCPLAGDDPFVHLLYRKGYHVTSIDLVPAAVEEMKNHFGSCEWIKEESDHDGTIIWKHPSGRVTLIVGDALQKRPEMLQKFDAVYDKDSFGALNKELRQPFCNRIAEFTKPNGIIYLECKLRQNHDEAKDMGPPFSLTQAELMEESSYGSSFEYVKGLGSVYEISMPMEQTGHILLRK